MTKKWIGLSVLALALTVSAPTCFACAEHAQAAEAKDVKTIAATGETKACDMPCCAQANGAPVETNAASVPADKPCSAGAEKGCAKKSGAAVAAVAKAAPVETVVKAEPAVDPGSPR